MTKADYRDLEILVAKIQKQLAPEAAVLHDVRLEGRRSKTKRQIDVLVRQKIGQHEMLIALDCKDYAKPTDVKKVEEFRGLLEDVGAHKGAIVCPRGFSAAAKARAADFQIDLYSPVDTDPHKWQVKMGLPTVCDFRTASISIGIRMSAPLPFMMPSDFFATGKAFNKDDAELGSPAATALKKWNSGGFPSEPGTYRDLPIFDEATVRVDNGYGMLVPVELMANIRVGQKLFYGLMPIAKITGFKDELSGGVITNAFEIGLLDPDEVWRDWKEIQSMDEAPRPLFMTLQGLLAWDESDAERFRFPFGSPRA